MDEQKKLVTMATAERIRYYRRQKGTYDETGNIGKRYRREDAMGTPYCITIDEETIGRFKDIIGRIPPDKFERFFQVIDALVDLL